MTMQVIHFASLFLLASNLSSLEPEIHPQRRNILVVDPIGDGEPVV